MDNIQTNDESQELNPHDTEIVAEREEEKVSIRDALSRQLKGTDDASENDENTLLDNEETTSVDQAEQQVEAAVERIPVVPPADMNKAEKDAFLNPTPQNAHVLQQYMNRRAYELRSDHQRHMVEIEQMKSQTAGVLDTIKQYESDYAKQGISLGDVAKRSIAWDQAMKADPVQTALEWLDSYGIGIEDLTQSQQQQLIQQGYQQQPQQNYLTREEAERIAEEKFQTYQEQQQQNAVAYYNERVVESFMSAKPLFRDPETASQLEAEMAPIVSALTGTGRYSSPEEILETAYNYVVAGNPTFSSLNQAMTAKVVMDQKQAAAQKAKSASRSISGSAGSGTPRVQTKDLRDNLRRRFGGE
jgi:hypothetical protein